MFLIKAAFRRYFQIIGMSILPLSVMRVWILRLIGVKIGHGCYVGFNVEVDTNYPELLAKGDNVTISHRVSFITHTATLANSKLSSVYNVQ